MKIINKTKKNLKLYMWDNVGEECPFATLVLKVDEETEKIPESTYLIKIEENE